MTSATDLERDPWLEVTQRILSHGGRCVVLILGAQETGKSTFLRRLAVAAADAGRTVEAISLDLAHADAALPGCIGLDRSPTALTSHEPSHQRFVGSLSPTGYTLETLSALNDLLLARNPDALLIVEGSGILRGAEAVRFQQACIHAVHPDHIVAIARGEELSLVLSAHRGMQSPALHLLHPSPECVALPPSYRSRRIVMRFSSLMRDWKESQYRFEDCHFAGTWLGSGAPLPPHLLTYLRGALEEHTRVYYAEKSGRRLGILVSHPLHEECTALSIALEQLEATDVTVTPSKYLKNLLVGLETAGGKFLGEGRIVSMDLRRQSLGIASGIRSGSAVKLVRFGGLCVAESGEITGHVYPGEI